MWLICKTIIKLKFPGFVNLISNVQPTTVEYQYNEILGTSEISLL